MQPISRISAPYNRQYQLNESFFDKIDTEAKAYWLGFITADGAIDDSRLKFCLSERDQSHLEKFTRVLESTHPVRIVEYRNYGVSKKRTDLNIGSTRLVGALNNLGIFEKKTFSVKPCKSVPFDLEHHYWRGVFDGDGCIASSVGKGENDTARVFAIGIVGNLYIVNGFASFVRKHILTQSSVNPIGKVYRFNVKGVSRPKQVVELLYKDATIYLDRKYDKAIELMETPVIKKDWDWITRDVLIAERLKVANWKMVSDNLGIDSHTMFAFRKRVYPESVHGR